MFWRITPAEFSLQPISFSTCPILGVTQMGTLMVSSLQLVPAGYKCHKCSQLDKNQPEESSPSKQITHRAWW